MIGLIVTLIGVLCFTTVHSGPTSRYSSGCSVDLCQLINTSNGSSNSSSSSCSQPPPCYLFESSTNLTFCGPKVICSMFDVCISGTRCASNTSVCIVNTCCSAPICMPLSLTSTCSMYTANVKPTTTWSSKICPNATWSDNGTSVSTMLFNSSYAWYGPSFALDKANNIYVVDNSNYRIMKITVNDSTVSVAVSFGSTTYTSQSIFIDSNGSIFSAESWNTYSTSYYRIVKYASNGMSTIMYGPTTCGSALTELCGTSSIFVDQSGNIFYSDASQHRVLKIAPFASSASLVAGTSGSSGSQLNQLSYPSGIFLDSNNTLYVADQTNSRVIKFTSGNSIGTVLFTLASYQTPTSVIVDSYGSVYAGTYNGVVKWVPGSINPTPLISSMYWSAAYIRMDSYGNLYTAGYSMTNIYKYNITSNSC